MNGSAHIGFAIDAVDAELPEIGHRSRGQLTEQSNSGATNVFSIMRKVQIHLRGNCKMCGSDGRKPGEQQDEQGKWNHIVI